MSEAPLIDPPEAPMHNQVSLSTRVKVWWDGVPLVTRSFFAICTAVYAAQLLTGWDDLGAVCLAPAPLVVHLQLYRILTSAVVHVGVLHLAFNMMAFLPIGTSLERSLGSVQLLWLIALIMVLGDAAYVVVAYAAFFLGLPAFMTQCAVGFSGVVFGLVVLDNDASGAAQRSIFGLFAVPAKAYPWALLLLWTLLIPQSSFLGHLSGLLVGQLYVWGWLRWAVPSGSTIHDVEHNALIARCAALPAFIVHTGGGGGGGGGGDGSLPVSRPSGAVGRTGSGGGAEAAASGPSWLRGPWMPFPSGYTLLQPAAASSSSSPEPARTKPPGEPPAAAAGGSSGGDGGKAAAVVGGAPTQLEPAAAAAAAAQARAAQGSVAAGARPNT